MRGSTIGAGLGLGAEERPVDVGAAVSYAGKLKSIETASVGNPQDLVARYKSRGSRAEGQVSYCYVRLLDFPHPAAYEISAVGPCRRFRIG